MAPITHPIPAKVDGIITEVIAKEGGYVNHPADRGGPTKWGITLATLRSYRGDDTLTAFHVIHLEREEAVQIYYSKYWVRGNLKAIGDTWAQHFIFDWMVNSGVRRVTRYVQRLVGAAPDGQLGPKTAEKINTFMTKPFAKREFIRERCRFYCNIVQSKPSQVVFIEGWIDRVCSFI